MKLLLFFTILIFGQVSLAQNHHNHDAPSVHGMLLFGQEKIYLSHLPMFHTPHDYQVLFEVEISDSVKQKYFQSIKNDPNETVYTIVPESFVLPEIVNTPKPFKAQLFKGHFERGGMALTSKVEFKIKKILYFKKFDKNAKKPESSPYILIGNEKEQFLIHTVTAKPDFDFISQVKLSSAKAIQKLSKVNHISITVESDNEKPLEAAINFIGQVTQSKAEAIEFNIFKSLYLEFGDLSF